MNSLVVDFLNKPRHIDFKEEVNVVYALFLLDRIVYVGSTTDLKNRLNFHRYKIKFDSFSFEKFPLDFLLEAETENIVHYRPVLNLRLPGGNNRYKTIKQIAFSLKFRDFDVDLFDAKFGHLFVFRNFYDVEKISPLVVDFYKSHKVPKIAQGRKTSWRRIKDESFP